jgi:maltose O-acetyltransferase
MSKLRNIKRMFILSIINTFFLGTHFYGVKRLLLKSIHGVSIGSGVRVVGPIMFFGNLHVGENTFIGRDFCIEGNGSVEIGANCDLAPHICLITGSHVVGNKERRAGNGFSGIITIGDGSWICTGTHVLPNVSIGKGVVVAAGALVNKDISDNAMVAGVPAKIQKILAEI